MLEITRGSGFRLTLGDRIISVQFGEGSYCDNRYKATTQREEKKDAPVSIWELLTANEAKKPTFEPYECENAEVAVTDLDGNWKTREVWLKCFDEEINDDVVGWVPANKVARVITHLHMRTI